MHSPKNKIEKLTLIFFVLLLLSCQEREKEHNTSVADISKSKTIDEKNSDFGELNPNAPKETLQFGQFVGKWNVISIDSIPNKGWHESKATWSFKYALDGFAIEDVWFEKLSDSTNNTKVIGRNFTGKNIRIYDPNTALWNMIWIENGSNTMMYSITAKMNEQSNIVMKSSIIPVEMTFFNITKDSFEWKYELLAENKRTVFSKMKASRLK